MSIYDSFTPDTCTIQRATDTVGTDGHPIKTFATLTSGVRCKIKEASGSEGVRDRREANTKAYVGHFPPGTALRFDDRVVFGTLTLEVKNVVERTYASGVVDCVQADLEVVV